MDGDSIKATPQSPVMGLFSDGLRGIDSALGSGDFSNALGFGPASRLAENMSYGSPPYRGSGMATKLHPDVATATGAALGYGGLAPISGSLKASTGLLGFGLQQHESLDSVIQGLLNALGRQAQNK